MGGEHKCPLCEATFTRPQHVGRHLRAHTGDRPYGCKECPLRFARSDLLSRHVNKTHRPPDDNAPTKESKRGRRKSLGSHGDGQPMLKPQDKVRAASFSLASGSQSASRPPAPTSSMPPPHIISRTPNFGSQPLSSAYPHAGPSSYNPPTQSAYHTAVPPTFVNPFSPFTTATSVQPRAAMHPPVYAAPLMMSGASLEQDSSPSSLTSSMTRNASTGSYIGPIGYADMGPKKRACDQCNHSKVRCDFADPCLRCMNKNLACSYIKPHKPRTMVLPVAPVIQKTSPSTSESISQTAGQLSSQPNYATPSMGLHLSTSMSPDSSFSSPYSNTSPLTSHLTPYPGASTIKQNEAERRRSAGNHQPQYHSLPRHSLPTQLYPHAASPMQPPWQIVDPQPHEFNYSTGVNYDLMPPQSVAQQYSSIAQYNTNPYPQLPQPQMAWSQTPQPHFAPVEPQRQLSTSTAVVSDTTSSPAALVITPALTNNSASPADPAQASSGGPPSVGQVQFNVDPTLRPESSGGLVRPLEVPYDLSTSVSPVNNFNPSYDMVPVGLPDMSQTADMSNMWLRSATAISANPSSLSAPEAPVDQMYQFRTSVLPRHQDDDDTTASQADSSAALSTFLEVDDLGHQSNYEQRRRASANGGVWATAFNNMTLHDSAGNPIPNGPGLPLAPSAMFLPTHLQLDAGVRPSLSAIENSHTDASGRMPSMSDVKDLWKLFMTDPLTGPTPSKEKSNFLDLSQAQNVTTPRPGMGFRTLSKSNSMPDLKSPQIGGQAFFASPNVGGSRNGAGPDGNTPTAQRRHNAGEAGGGNNSEVLKEWQEKIKHRQASFSMAMQHPGTVGRRAGQKGDSTSRSGSIPNLGTAESSQFMFENNSQSPPDLQPRADYSQLSNSTNHTEITNRPMASVFQRSQALDQTLGPERAPSFGLALQAGTQHFEPVGGVPPAIANYPRMMSQYQHSLSHLQPQPMPPPPTYQARQAVSIVPGGDVNAQSAAAVGKVTSTLARPGNKRLASQTLAGAADGKKANFLVFDGGMEEDEDDDANGDGVMGYAGMGLGGIGGQGLSGVGVLGGVVPVIPAEWQKQNA